MAKLVLAKDLTYVERPFRILQEMQRVTHSKEIKSYKVQWEHHNFLEHPIQNFFLKQPNLEDEIHPKWGWFVTLWFLLVFAIIFFICLFL